MGMNQPGLKGLVILVAEDQNVLRTTTGMFLMEQGATVIEADNGSSALNLFVHNQNRINIVFTDIKMPKMNGFELFRHIQTIKPGTKVIFTSGFEVPEDERSIVPEKIFIAKPFRGQQLVSKIWDVLRNDFSGLLKQELPHCDFNFLKPNTPQTIKQKRQRRFLKLPGVFSLNPL
jgi:response regulator RpfG family c-di-GMP phosphodiesterase